MNIVKWATLRESPCNILISYGPVLKAIHLCSDYLHSDYLKKLNDWQFEILSHRPLNCWSDIDNQERKQMMLLPANISDNLNGRQSVINVTENLYFARIYWEVILSTYNKLCLSFNHN